MDSKTRLNKDTKHNTFGLGLVPRSPASRVNHRYVFFISTLVFLFFAITPSFAQKAKGTKGKSKQQLQSEITSLQKEISTANQLLKKTSKDKEMTLSEVNILDKKIKQREQLIKAYNEQIALLDEEISAGKSSIRNLNCNTTDWSLPGSSVHGIFQTWILGWVLFPSPGHLPNPRIEPTSPLLQADSSPSEPPEKSFLEIVKHNMAKCCFFFHLQH